MRIQRSKLFSGLSTLLTVIHVLCWVCSAAPWWCCWSCPWRRSTCLAGLISLVVVRLVCCHCQSGLRSVFLYFSSLRASPAVLFVISLQKSGPPLPGPWSWSLGFPGTGTAGDHRTHGAHACQS